MARQEYSPEQVTKALMQLVANAGNVRKTAQDLIDESFQVPEPTLRIWKNERHVEQYRRLEEKYGQELEALAVESARQNIQLASQKKRELLDRIEPDKVTVSDLPQMLKAVTDAQAKGTNALLQLTGRPTNPQGSQGSEDVVRLLQTMAERGYLALAPGVSVEAPTRVPNQAEEA
jgi:methionyl-tRNA synthetase